MLLVLEDCVETNVEMLIVLDITENSAFLYV